jgi:hypothetical protein
MNQEEIQAKAAELAALYTAVANGKTLQCLLMLDPKEGCWIDHDNGSGPNLHSDLSKWRVKPEPRRMWETFSLMETKDVGIAPCRATHTEAEADEWRVKGYKVTEWLEVLS